jgi:hypothetical protein
MVFEVQGKTDNYVQLQKDGNGVEFLGKLLFEKYPKTVLFVFDD